MQKLLPLLPYTNKSCHTHEWVMAHTWMHYVTHVKMWDMLTREPGIAYMYAYTSFQGSLFDRKKEGIHDFVRVCPANNKYLLDLDMQIFDIANRILLFFNRLCSILGSDSKWIFKLKLSFLRNEWQSRCAKSGFNRPLVFDICWHPKDSLEPINLMSLCFQFCSDLVSEIVTVIVHSHKSDNVHGPRQFEVFT